MYSYSVLNVPDHPSNVVIFDSDVDSGWAYNLTQTSDDIHDADVLIVPSERIVGVMYSAWPTAITLSYGEFHTLSSPPPDPYSKAIELATSIATLLGLMATESE